MFEFGYVVHACWAQPITMPVTNPETDFPVEANCEDPWEMTIEQLQPIDYDIANKPLFKATVKHRPLAAISAAYILVPSLSSYQYYDPTNNPIMYQGPEWEPEYYEIIDDETTEIILRIKPIQMSLIGDGLVPGHHLGILQVLIPCAYDDNGWLIPSPYKKQLNAPLGVMPVDVYVEL